MTKGEIECYVYCLRQRISSGHYFLILLIVPQNTLKKTQIQALSSVTPLFKREKLILQFNPISSFFSPSSNIPKYTYIAIVELTFQKYVP